MASKIELFYFNKKFTTPIIFILAKITSSEEEKLLANYTDTIFGALIDNNLAKNTDILIFSIIKEHKSKLINWILPSTMSNKSFVKNIQNNKDFVNKVVSQTIKNSNCEILIILENNEIQIKNCDINLGFIGEVYY
jgi:hypothetical protein